jgi:hypothetical protein
MIVQFFPTLKNSLKYNLSLIVFGPVNMGQFS